MLLSRDVKLNKHDKMLDELVKAKTDLEAKINSFDKRFNEILEVNNNLEAKLESSNVKIICLEAKIEAHETKIADLEAQKDNVSPIEETVDIKPEICVLDNLIGKRPHVPDNNHSTNKRTKINDVQNLQSTEHPKDVERALNILSLASNLKEFFFPALTSDPKWNLEFEYIPDFDVIEKNETNFMKECTYNSLLSRDDGKIGLSIVKVYQNPNIPGFVRVDFVGKGKDYIFSFQNNKINQEGVIRYWCKTIKMLANRKGNSLYGLYRQDCGKIFYYNKLFVNGKYNNQFPYVFDSNTLAWSLNFQLLNHLDY